MMIDLRGIWRFQLDPDDVGIVQHWHARVLADEITLPDSLQAQGYGQEVAVDTRWVGSLVDRTFYDDPRYAPYREPGNVKIPFWLTPDKVYMGAAWYQRDVDIPEDWAGRRLTLFLERPHWGTRVWLDDVYLGEDLSLATPHVYPLGAAVESGRHRLTIRVDNRMLVEVGENAHSVSDHTQGNWNGIVGRLELSSSSPVWIEEVQVYPKVSHKRALVKIKLANVLARPGTARLTLAASAYNTETPHAPKPVTTELPLPAGGTTAHVELLLGEAAQLWDEFSPALYRLDCRLVADLGELTYQDKHQVSFGMRNMGVKGTQLTLNGRPLFLRGTLECCIFPLTGYPPTEVAAWKRIIRICQSHGLNHIRFHSWCPPQAAFVAADELGFTYQVECSSWANQGSALGEGRPIDRWLYAEGERIISAYGNHPSFIMMAYGNEPAGDFVEYLGVWVDYWRGRDPRRIHTGGAGWPIIPENEYHNTPLPRIQGWGEELNSRINARPPETLTDYSNWVDQWPQPLVSHEIGQWCVYPNFAEMEKYTGPLKARNFEVFHDFLEANHMGDQAHDFLMASGKLQALCYKEEIESAMRTPGFGGFQLLDLHDFPGQGTALVGVLDPFWDSKPYLSPEGFRRFCGPTVPLARMEKRYWHTGETFTAAIDVAHFGPVDLNEVTLSWRLLDGEGAAVASASSQPLTIPTGTVSRCGRVQVELSSLESARRYKLTARIEGVTVDNDWDIWLFPETLATDVPEDIMVVDSLDEAALSQLETGGKVLLLATPGNVRVQSRIGFSSMFWNTSWTRGQAPHTLGILCDPEHPVFAHFPSDYHSDWQWWEIIHGSEAMVLDGLPVQLRPLVQPIDNWFEARRLGLLFEAMVNGGRLMVCSMDLQTDLNQRLVARQMWHSLVTYLGSDSFAPQVSAEVNAIRELFQDA